MSEPWPLIPCEPAKKYLDKILADGCEDWADYPWEYIGLHHVFNWEDRDYPDDLGFEFPRHGKKETLRMTSWYINGVFFLIGQGAPSNTVFWWSPEVKL